MSEKAEKMEKVEKGEAKVNSVQEFSTDLLKVYYGEFVSSTKN